MATFTGISTLTDLPIQVLKGSAISYGLDKLYAEIDKSLAAYNAQVSEVISEFCEMTEKQAKVFNFEDALTMTKADEFGKSRSKKSSGSWSVAFPLDKWIAGDGYSNDWLKRASVSDVSVKLTRFQIAHQKNLVSMVKNAIYKKDDFSFVDQFYNGETLTIRRFWNGDNALIPPSMCGTSFNKSHNHYLALAGGSPANSDITGTISTVTEHDQLEGMKVIINPNDYDKVAALSDFTPLSSGLIVYNASNSTVDKLDNTNLNNRLIGYWKNTYEVWTKPYAVQNYLLALASDSQDGKPLAYRQLPYENLKGLMLNNGLPSEPIICEEVISYEGMGVQNRSCGAVLYMGGTTWTDPVI